LLAQQTLTPHLAQANHLALLGITEAQPVKPLIAAA